MIDSDRLRALSIFEKLRHAPAAQRDQLIAAEAGDSAELRAEIFRLLENDSPTSFFLGKPRGRTTLDLLRSVEAEAPTTIGQYRIEREIGRGGFGVVYLAQQTFPQRAVAIKVMRPLFSEDEARRFQFEADALARLDHPGVARVFEAGVWHGSGDRPYIVMEFVDGQPLQEFINSHTPGIGERLRIITSLCDAVSHAHQRGVIHRDLSPRNILVTADGSPKVLDFGLACRVDRGQPGAALDITQDGMLMGTVRYMSPEQLRASRDKIDVRCDVYALGVIAYELLTDHHPYLRPDSSLAESIEALVDKPATRPRHFAPGLPVDLDAVLLKAIDRDPSRRYQSAVDFAADLHRVTQGLPVAARTASIFYRTRRFAGRHRAPVTVAVLVCSGLLFAGGKTLAAMQREAQAREGAIVALEAIVSRLISPLAAKIGTLQDRAALLETIRPEVERFAARAPNDPRSLRVLGSFLVALGDVHRDQGKHDSSLSAYSRGAQAYCTLWGIDQADPDIGHAYSLATVKLGDAHRHAGRFEQGMNLYRDALALDESLVERAPQSIPLLSNLFWSYVRSETLLSPTDYEASLEYLQRAAEVAERMVAISPDEWRSLEALSRIRQRQLYAASHTQDAAAAERYSLDALDAAQRLVRLDPQGTLHQGIVVEASLDHALFLTNVGRADEAQLFLNTARGAAAILCRDGCDPGSEATYLTRIESVAAGVAQWLGDDSAAIEHATRHAAGTEILYAKGVRSIDLLTQRSNCLMVLIRAYTRNGRHPEALEAYLALVDLDEYARTEYAGTSDSHFVTQALGEARAILAREASLTEPQTPLP
jgi:tetratricopeptide (TPR) repeat protein/predicted Ser/Thr protein kinase